MTNDSALVDYIYNEIEITNANVSGTTFVFIFDEIDHQFQINNGSDDSDDEGHFVSFNKLNDTSFRLSVSVSAFGAGFMPYSTLHLTIKDLNNTVRWSGTLNSNACVYTGRIRTGSDQTPLDIQINGVNYKGGAVDDPNYSYICDTDYFDSNYKSFMLWELDSVNHPITSFSITKEYYHKLDANFLPTGYVGPDIPRRRSNDIYLSVNSVVVPVGYYQNLGFYNIPTMTLPTSTSSSWSGSNMATISPSTSTQYLNIPSGYNSSNRYYTISAVTYSKITVSTANPSGGANGDVWIKT